MAKAISELGELKWIPMPIPRSYRALELCAKAIARIFGKNICFNYTHWGSKLLSSKIDSSQFDDCDILIAFWSGSQLMYMDTKGKPIIYLSDATFPAMIDYYPPFCKLPRFNIKQGHDIEKKSLDKASYIILSSDWAAHSAIKDLHQQAEKILVVEFGANIDNSDIIKRTSIYKGHLDLLFLGVEWERKGGDIALKACKWLNENGIKSTLHLVGIRKLSKKIANLPYVDYIGFLDKNKPEEYKKLVNIIQNSHCLLLPTLAECAGIAFAEASAYGLPVYTYNTGGVSNYIYEGKNGYMMPLGSSGEDFGKKIKEDLECGELEKMSLSAREVYAERLNWDTWQKKMEKIINQTL